MELPGVEVTGSGPYTVRVRGGGGGRTLDPYQLDSLDRAHSVHDAFSLWMALHASLGATLEARAAAARLQNEGNRMHEARELAALSQRSLEEMEEFVAGFLSQPPGDEGPAQQDEGAEEVLEPAGPAPAEQEPEPAARHGGTPSQLQPARPGASGSGPGSGSQQQQQQQQQGPQQEPPAPEPSGGQEGPAAAAATGQLSLQRRACSNCGLREPLNSRQALCHPCHVYQHKNGRPRPEALWHNGLHLKTSGGSGAAAAPTASVPAAPPAVGEPRGRRAAAAAAGAALRMVAGGTAVVDGIEGSPQGIWTWAGGLRAAGAPPPPAKSGGGSEQQHVACAP